MATTYTYKNGDGQQATTYSFTFPYIKDTDVKVEVLESGAWVTKTKDTHYGFANATSIQFKTDHVPSAAANNIKISRATDADKLTATFYPGSAIRSGDLNENFTQNLYSTEEAKETGDDAQLATDRLVAVTYDGGTTWTQTGNNTNASTDPKGVGYAVTEAEAAVDKSTTVETLVHTYVHDGTNLKGSGTGGQPQGVKYAIDQAVAAVASAATANDTADAADTVADNAKLATDRLVATTSDGGSTWTVAGNNTNASTDPKGVGYAVTTAEAAFQKDGSSKMTGNIVFDPAGASHETTLAVTNPTGSDKTITLPNVTGTVVTTGDTGTVTSTMITDLTIATGDIADTAVTNAKLGDLAVTDGKLANGAVINTKLGALAVTNDKLANGAVTNTKIDNLAVTEGKLANGAVTANKIGNDVINEHHMGDDAIVSVAIKNLAVTTDKLAADAVTSAKIGENELDSEHYAAGSIDTEHIADLNITTGLIDNLAVTDGKIAENAVTIGKLGCTQVVALTDSDNHIPTSGAVVDYVAGQLAPIGGFEAIANEDLFPTTQPAAGVIVSISDAAGVEVTSDGTLKSTTARRDGSGSDDVVITGFPSSLSGETLAASVGLMVSSDPASNTGGNHYYKYHKILAAEGDVKQLSDDINDFNERYRTANTKTNNNDSSNHNGDLFFDQGAAKMFVYSGDYDDSGSWGEVTSTGDYRYLFLCPTGGSGPPTFGGASYDLRENSNSGTVASVNKANQLLVSINGVLQKPNTGTTAPSEGFALVDSNSIIFGSNITDTDSVFITQIGTATTLNSPADGSVTEDKIASTAVTTGKIADNAVDGGKLANNLVLGTTLTVGADTDGHDVKFFGNTTGKYCLWDESNDQLDVVGDIVGEGITSGSSTNDNVTLTAWGQFTSHGQLNLVGGDNSNPGTITMSTGGLKMRTGSPYVNRDVFEIGYSDIKLYGNNVLSLTVAETGITGTGSATFGTTFDTSSSSGYGLKVDYDTGSVKRGAVTAQADGNNTSYAKLWEGYNGSSNTSSIDAQGVATFAQQVTTGSDPYNGGGTGGKLATGAIQMSNSSSNALWTGHTTGSATVTSQILASGFATFAQTVKTTPNVGSNQEVGFRADYSDPSGHTTYIGVRTNTVNYAYAHYDGSGLTSSITLDGAATFAGPLDVGSALNSGSGVNIYGGGSIYIRQTGTGASDKLLILQNNNSAEVANLNGAGGATFTGNVGVGTAAHGTVTHHVKNVGTDWTGRFESAHASNPYGIYINYPNHDPNSASGNEFISCYATPDGGSNTAKFKVYSNGGVWSSGAATFASVFADYTQCNRGTAGYYLWIGQLSGSNTSTITAAGDATFNTVSDSKGELRSIPQNTQAGAYTLVAADAGKHIFASGNINTGADNVFSAGDAVTIVNNTASDLTITRGITTMYNAAGGDTNSSTYTLAARGMVTILFVAGDEARIAGGGLS